MLDTRERAITFRDGLPIQQRNWGSLHEIGHDFLPWQKQVLYYCPLLMLPNHIQEQFEMEADVFAAEAFFFGDRFREYAAQGNLGLSTAVDLATNMFETSLHATFRHYVENSDEACCLLVWQPAPDGGDLCVRGESSMSLHYYVPSPSFRGHISPGQIADSDNVVSRIYSKEANRVVKHQMEFRTESGETLATDAESFCNSYAVFTLILQPQLFKPSRPSTC